MVVVVMEVGCRRQTGQTGNWVCRVDLEVGQPADPLFSLDLLRDVGELLGHRVPEVGEKAINNGSGVSPVSPPHSTRLG